MNQKTNSGSKPQKDQVAKPKNKMVELKKLKPREIHTTRFGISLILLAVIGVVLLSLAGRGTFVTIQIKEGISVFAVAYLDAQVIERAVEPFSEIKLSRGEMTKTQLFSDTVAIKLLRESIKDLEEKKNRKKEDISKLAGLHRLLDALEAKRVVAFWGLTSLLGILLCYLTVGLFEIVGVTFSTVVVAGGTITGHTFDSILSGMIVGAGTKPLHDLIGYLEKAKQG